MASREINIVIKAQNLAGAALKGVQGELKSIQKDIGRGFAKAGRNIERGIGIGVAAAVGGLAYAVKQAGDFEAALNTINTVANLSATDLTAVGDSLRKMARDTGTSLDELTAGYYDLVSAGISAKDAQNVLTQANTLAIGGLGTTAETVDLLTTAINSYGGDASKAREYTDQFAEAIAAGKVTASELAESFAQVGPIAAQANIGVDELAAGYAVMTATGTPAAEASTQMRAALVALMKPTSELEGLQKKLNVNFLEMAKEKGLAFAYNEIKKAADDAGIEMVALTGRVEGANFAAQVAGPNYARYAAELDKVRHSSDGAGVAAEQMAQRQKGLNFQLNRLKEQARDAAITIGEAVIPKLVPLMEKASTWIEAHRGDIANFARDVAAAVERGVEWASKLDWEGIGNSLKMAAGFAKGLVEAFLAMPDWVKQAVITGWGLNKLTGGALSSILGSVLSGVIKGVLGINAGVVNVKGAVVNGVGGGAIGGAAGKGGRGGFLGGVWKALPALFVAELATEFGPQIVKAGTDLHPDWLPTIDLSDVSWPFGPKNTPTILPEVFGGNGLLGGTAAGKPEIPQPAGRSGSAAGGGFGPAGSDAAGADAVLTQNFGGKMDKLATNDVLEALGRTTEMGLKGVGTSVEEGVKTGMDPLGDIATRILAHAKDPKAPEVMNEIQGHLAGLEEIQQTYLNQGDIKLAQKVQANIDTLHDLIGTTDQTRSVTQRMAADAASNDRAMLNSALTQTGKLSAIEGVQRGQSGTLTGILQKKSSVNVNVNATVNVSVAEWQRTAVANARANSNSGGFI